MTMVNGSNVLPQKIVMIHILLLNLMNCLLIHIFFDSYKLKKKYLCLYPYFYIYIIKLLLYLSKYWPDVRCANLVGCLIWLSVLCQV